MRTCPIWSQTMNLKHALPAIFLILSFAAPVAAGPFEDAAAAYGRGDYATALSTRTDHG